MLRSAVLCATMGILAQVLPQGCPIGPGDGADLTPRKTIVTKASAPVSVNAADTVVLLATAAADVDGGAVSYNWLQVAGPGVSIVNASQASASFVSPSLLSDQTLRFIVTTINERGDVGRAEVSVLVLADPNYGDEQEQDTTGKPVARAGQDSEAVEGSAVTLDGTSSSGNQLTYSWKQLEGSTAEIAQANAAIATFEAPSFVAGGNNLLEFELEIRDYRGRGDTDQVSITVREAAEGADSHPRVKVKTSKGDFVIELDREKAPITVENFLIYVDDGFYDGTIFHRVIPEFVVQGGGFIRTDGKLEEKETRDPIAIEADNGLKNDRGTVAMARTNDPDSATSQFFVNLVDNDNLNPGGVSPEGYAVFGEVVEGMDVLDAIAEVSTGSQGGMQDVPDEDVELISIKRVASSGITVTEL